MSNKIKVAIVGTGTISNMHIQSYLNNPNVELYAFCDLDEAKVKMMAEKYGVSRTYTDEETMLKELPEIDAVSVCVWNSNHMPCTVMALNYGKHVLCEKPMAVTDAQCQEMLAAAKQSGKRLLIAQNQRFAKAHMAAKQMLEEGVIGKVITFRSTFGHGGPETWSISPGKDTWFFDKKRAAMGAMADLGIHKTDLLRYLLGQDVVRTTARLVTLDKRGPDDRLIGVDDNAFCIYEMSGGVFGTMTVSWTYYGAEDNSTVLYGTGGIMRIYDDPAHSIVVRTAEGEEKFFDVEQIQTNDNQTASGVIDEFVSAVEEGRPSELDADDVIKSMKAVFASIRSAEEGRTVEVE